MHPNKDTFLTTSMDATSRLWDLTTRQCLYIFKDSNFSSFNNNGNILISVTTQLKQSNNFLNFYQSEKISDGPFKVCSIDGNSSIVQIQYSHDDLYIIAKDKDNLVIVLESFSCTQLLKFKCEISDKPRMNFELTTRKFDISIDSEYLAISSETGNVLIYRLSNGNLVTILQVNSEAKKEELSASMCAPVKFSPKSEMIATNSEKNLILWE